MKNEGRKITKIAREAQKLVSQSLPETGIGSGEIEFIHLVRHHAGISQAEAAAQLNIDKAAVARRANSLEKKGYIERKPDPDDKRIQRLYATEKALQLKLDKVNVEAEFYAWLLEDVPNSEEFLQTLDAIYNKAKRESRAGFPHVKERLDHE